MKYMTNYVLWREPHTKVNSQIFEYLNPINQGEPIHIGLLPEHLSLFVEGGFTQTI